MCLWVHRRNWRYKRVQTAFFFDQTVDPILFISGLRYIPKYINSQEEIELLNIIDSQPWITDLKRRVHHYGWCYDYKARNVAPESRLGPLTEWLASYCDRLYSDGFFPEPPDQIIVNEYNPGQGISPHIDCVPCFTDTISSLSLGSPCVMEFTHTATQEKNPVLLEPRSLIVLTGDARYLWQHAIPHRKIDRHEGQIIQRTRRISLTFRKVTLGH